MNTVFPGLAIKKRCTAKYNEVADYVVCLDKAKTKLASTWGKKIFR